MTQLLTRRKERWAGMFKPKVIRGKPLNPSVVLEQRYYDELRYLVMRMSKHTEKELLAFFKEPHAEEYFAEVEDASVGSQARILVNALQRVFDDIFSGAAKPLAETMVGASDRDSQRSLKRSLKELSGGLVLDTSILTGELKDILTASVAENVGLIKSIATQYLDGVRGAVMRSITTGNGLQDLVPFLAAHEGVTLRRARGIARDQTVKAYSSINKARMQAIGIDDYEWLHSGGSQHPRQEHIAMSGNIYSLSKPPVIDKKTGERGIPGQLIFCKCRMVPVVKFNEGARNAA